MKIKAIAFDFDGVILDTYENHYQSYSKKYEINRNQHKQIFEGNVLETKNKLKIHNPHFNVIEALKEHILSQKIDEEILKTLKSLKEKYKIFIISSSKESTLKPFFEKENMSEIFDEILGKETNTKKDKKFELLFKKYNLKNNEIIFITDTLGDILEANKLNIKSIGVDFGFHEKERLQKGNPYKIISKFEDLLKIF